MKVGIIPSVIRLLREFGLLNIYFVTSSVTACHTRSTNGSYKVLRKKDLGFIGCLFWGFHFFNFLMEMYCVTWLGRSWKTVRLIPWCMTIKKGK